MYPPQFIVHLRTPPFSRSTYFLHLAPSTFLHFAFFISHPPPRTDSQAPSLSFKGYSSGNNLPWQGQRQPPQSLRQWNQWNDSRAEERVLCFPLALVYFISFPCFPSYLDIRNIPVQAFENWLTNSTAADTTGTTNTAFSNLINKPQTPVDSCAPE